jgi:phospholipase/lecithinase/hemolysin
MPTRIGDMKVTATVLVVAVALVSFAQRTAAQPFTQVIVFGDSNVDSGFYKALSSPGGSTTYNNLWPSAVAHGAGAPTTSPGLMNSQFLAAFFNLTANPANTAGGTNYATSGAKNEIPNSAANGGFTAAIPTGTQIRNYLSAHGGVADSQALYLIWSGDNDVGYANGDTGTSPPLDPNSYVMEAAEDLNGDILILRNAGAQHIIVTGLAYDYPTGNSADAVNKRALKLLYTQTLFQNLTQIGVTYYQADIDKVRLAISANPSNYGFTNIGTGVGQMGCTQPNGISTAWALLCSSDASAPSTLVSPTSPSTDLFADDQHLGTAGQKLMANFLYRLVVPPTITHNFNVDRMSDILWRNTNGDTSIWLMTVAQSGAAQVLSTADYGAIPNSWQIFGQRDFNGDGKADLLWRNTNGDMSIWLMNGTQVSSAVDLGFVPTSWVIVGTGDFNGDGNGDILWRNGNGDTSIWLMKGTQILSTVDFGVVPASWTIMGTADFNADGKSDILWHNSNGDTSIWLMNGGQVSSTVDLGLVPAGWSIVGTGDFNGDGKSDILWRHTNGDTSIWLMTVNGTQVQVLSASDLGFVPTSWNVAITGDFNGDGKSDVLWSNTNGDTSIWFMNGSQVSSVSDLGVVPNSWVVQGLGAD